MLFEKHSGPEKANEIFVEAGYKAGGEFCKNVLNCSLDFNGFVANLTETLEKFGIGVLRVEKADLEKMSFVLTVSEDLDCVRVFRSVVFQYAITMRGFIAGIMHSYTGKNFRVKEIDCWCTGDRTCRFTVDLLN